MELTKVLNVIVSSDEGFFATAQKIVEGGAEEKAVRTVDLACFVYGNVSLEVADSKRKLADLLFDGGRYADAEPLYREALEIGREVLGTQHPVYATNLNNLAGLLEATGRYAEAEPLYREALEIDRQVLGEPHPDYATGLNNLAGLLRATGRYAEAEPLLREALEVFQELFGAEHPDTERVRQNLETILAERAAE